VRPAHALSLILLACGGSSEADTEDDEIRIGVLLPYTGKDGSAGVNYERGVLMAVDQINDAGGLYGKPIGIEFADTHSEVERGLAGARELVDRNVVAIIGPEDDELARALPAVLEPADVVLVTPSSSSVPAGTFADAELWFRLAPSSLDLGIALARRMKADGVTKAAIVSTEAEYEASFAQGVEQRAIESGLVITASERISAGAGDYTAVVSSLLAGAPDAIVLAADASTGSKVVNDFAFAGGSSEIRWYLSPSLEQPGFVLNTAPDEVEGMIGVAPAVSPEEARQAAFRRAFMERWNGASPSTGAFYYFDALALFAVAFEGAASASDSATPPGELVRQYMLSASGQSGLVFEWDELPEGIANARQGQAVYYSGTTGVISLDASGGRSAAYTRFWTIRDGTIIPLP
jgi:branched-chain amino acid transport system substrate-binding protein